MASVIGKWRNITGRRITNPADTLTFIVEAYANANPASENGVAGVLFTLSDSLGNQLPVPVNSPGVWFPYFSEYTSSKWVSGVSGGMSPVPSGYGFAIPVAALPFGTVRCTAKVVANNGAEYTLPYNITVFNDSDGGDRRPSNKVLYVAPIGGGGSDSNPGTIGSPLASMQKAVTLAVKNRATANSVFTDADAGGAEIILLDGTHIWANNPAGDYSLWSEYWHTGDDWWLTIKSLTGNAIITRVTEPVDKSQTQYPESGLGCFGWRANATAPYQGNRNIRLANVKIAGAGAIRTSTTGVRFWLDGGESYSVAPKITEHTVMYAARVANNGNLPSVDSNLGFMISSGHYRHNVTGGWYDWNQIIDCQIRYTVGITAIWADAKGGDMVNCVFDDMHSFTNPGGAAVTDGYVWVVDGSKLSVSIPSPGLMRVDSTGSLATLANDFRSVTTNGFAAQFNHIISANTTLSDDTIRVGFRNFPAASNNGIFPLVSAGVNGNGTEYVVCQNPSAVAQVGAGGSPGSTSEMFTATARTNQQWNDAIHPDILQFIGSNSNFLVSNIAVRNYIDGQAWFISAAGGAVTNGWFVNISDGGRGGPASQVSNFSGSGLIDCGFVNCNFTGDLQFGSAGTKTNTCFVNNVFRLTAQTPAHGTSATSCYWTNNHWIIQPPTFGADAARGLNASTGTWYNAATNVAPFYLTPAVGNFGTGSSFNSAPTALLWPGTAAQTKGVWRNVGEYSYQNMSGGSGPVTANATPINISLGILAATASSPRIATAAPISISLSQQPPTIRVRANANGSLLNMSLITPIEVYASPGVEDFRSTTFSVTIEGKSTYVYGYEEETNVKNYYNPTGALGDLNVSWLVFGAGRTAQLTITKKNRLTGLKQNISSVSLTPGNTGATYQIVNGDLILDVPINTRLIVLCNNDYYAGRLVLHSTPIREAVFDNSVTITPLTLPSKFSSDTSYYLVPGVYDIGIGYSVGTNTNVYLEGGAVLHGTLNFTGSNNTKIHGRGGVISDIVIYDVDLAVITDFEERLSYSQLYRDPVSVWIGDSELCGIFLVASPFYAVVGAAHKAENITILNCWHAEGDGYFPASKSIEEPLATVNYSIIFAGDDALHLDVPTSTLVNRCLIGTDNNSAIAGGYNSPSPPGFPRVAQDCDLFHLTCADVDISPSAGYIPPWPPRGGSAVIKAFTDGPTGTSSLGVFFLVVSTIRIWGPIQGRVLALGNVYYMYELERQNQAQGQVAACYFGPIWTEQTPGQPSFIDGLDYVNTPHDIDLVDWNFGGVQITKSNSGSYITQNQYPYNIRLDGIPLNTHVFAPSANYASLVAPSASVTIGSTAQVSVQSLSISTFVALIKVSTTANALPLGLTIGSFQAFASVFTPPSITVQSLSLTILSASARVTVLAIAPAQSMSLVANAQPQNTIATSPAQTLSITQRTGSVNTGSSIQVSSQSLTLTVVNQNQPTTATNSVSSLLLSAAQAVAVGTVRAPVTPITLALLPIDAYAVNPGTVIAPVLTLQMLIFTQLVRVPVVVLASTQNISISQLDATATTGASTVVARQNLLFTIIPAESATTSSAVNLPISAVFAVLDASVRAGTKADAPTLVASITTMQAQATTSAEIAINPIYMQLSSRVASAQIPSSGDVLPIDVILTILDAMVDTSVSALATPEYMFLGASDSEGYGVIQPPSVPDMPPASVRESLEPEILPVLTPSEEWRIVQSS